MKDIKANRSVSLPEQNLIRATGYLDGVPVKRLDQFRIGEKCGRVEPATCGPLGYLLSNSVIDDSRRV